MLTVSGSTSPYQFEWSNGENSASNSQLAPGNYFVTVTDANCPVTADFALHYQYNFTVSASPSVSIALDDNTPLSFTLNGDAGNFTSVWSPSCGLSCNNCQSPVAAPVNTVQYKITVTNDEGCTGSDTTTVYVTPFYNLFVPNAFSPNGDGNNDVFSIYLNKQAVDYLNIQIFNRWGEKVYESNDMNFKWDGEFKGRPAPMGVYVYQVHLVFLDNHTEKLFKGGVTLIR